MMILYNSQLIITRYVFLLYQQYFIWKLHINAINDRNPAKKQEIYSEYTKTLLHSYRYSYIITIGKNCDKEPKTIKMISM